MKTNFDPFVVPDEVLALDQLPLTTHGKVDRAALNARLEDRMAKEDAILNTMVCTSHYDAIRWGFAKCLQVPFGGLVRTSSFFQLGGHSLAAIQLSKLLLQQGYAIAILDILKGDTIGDLEDKLTRINERNGTPNSNGTIQASEPPPATDMHRVMLIQAQLNPVTNCHIASAKFVGTRGTVPTPSELRAAWITTLAAHSIFKTRYDLQSWTLHDVYYINLDWEEVSVEAEQFDKALMSVEEQVWAHHQSFKKLPNSSLKVPYCHMTCVYAPNRKAIGFVWKVHHVLTDIFPGIIIMRDLERALAKEKVPPGPRIQDYSRFMKKFKDDNLDRATKFWTKMMSPLSDRFLFDFKPPQASFEGNAWRGLPFTTKETLESIEASVHALNIRDVNICCMGARFGQVLALQPCLILSQSLWSNGPLAAGAVSCGRNALPRTVYHGRSRRGKRT
jgi:hypothetical protein